MLWGQCGDGEVELWEECYSIAFTYDLDLSGQDLSGNIPRGKKNLNFCLVRPKGVGMDGGKMINQQEDIMSVPM